MAAISDLLAVVDAFRAKREVSDARVSTLVFNDGGRIAQLRSGRDIGTRLLERSFQWFSDHWPEGADWPADVPRPPASESTPSEPERAAS